MDVTRKLVIFPVDQFYVVVGNVTLPKDPYGISLTDILNDRSALTHRQGDHEHRPGRIFLTDAECYALHDNTRRICTAMIEVFVPVRQIRAVIDVHPERYQGNADKRRESQERVRRNRELLFALHGHTLHGAAETLEVYRKSDQFVSLTGVTINEEPAGAAGLSLPGFLHQIGCPPPDFMAVNLGCVIHS
jgi:hypothetical protein